MKKIVILGAGPTGLGAAHELSRRGYGNWEIYEKNDHVGGLSASFRDREGFTWDIGGHILFSTDRRFNRLVDDLLGEDLLSFVRESWIWIRESFVRYPFQNNFHLHPDKELVLDCLVGLVEASRRGRDFRNFEEWIGAFFGEGISRHFMLPYNRKVWAIPLDRMDFRWISDRVSVIDLKTILGSLLLSSPEGGWGPNNNFRYPLHGGTGGLYEKFLAFTGDRLRLGRKAVRVRPNQKEIVFSDGSVERYDVLIASVPLDELLAGLEGAPERIRDLAGKLVSNRGFMVGVGIGKSCPSSKNWMYFPENGGPFYRVTYLSNYSPNNAPPGEHFSLLAETSYSPARPASRETILDETIRGLIHARLLDERDRDRIVSTWVHDVDHSYPVPFTGRDEVLAAAQGWLQEKQIYSRGRFGGWKYEFANMDHSVLQGIEAVERILDGKTEGVYRIP